MLRIHVGELFRQVIQNFASNIGNCLLTGIDGRLLVESTEKATCVIKMDVKIAGKARRTYSWCHHVAFARFALTRIASVSWRDCVKFLQTTR